jgi:hypothetical protein
LAGQQRRHVRSDRDDLNLVRIDPVLGHQRAQQDHTRCLNADPLAGEIGGIAHRVFRQRKEGVGVLLRRYGKAFDRQILRHRQHQGWARRNLTDLVSPGCYDGDAIIIRPARLDLKVQALFLEITEAEGAYLPELVTAAEPTELHVERGCGSGGGGIGQGRDADSRGAARRATNAGKGAIASK